MGYDFLTDIGQSKILKGLIGRVGRVETSSGANETAVATAQADATQGIGDAATAQAAADAAQVDATQALADAATAQGTVDAILTGYTVAGLAGLTPVQGDRAFVTDATAPTYLGTLTGGGAVVCPVFYNGSAWVSA